MNHMNRALTLASRALGSVSPNPAVGSVVVKDGTVVGEGWTQRPGKNHAEIVALRQAGEKATGATLYTTLEPCCHHGKTPPCTEAIIQAGIVSVFAAVEDPNPAVLGKGISHLARKGIRTDVGQCEADALKITEAYRKFITTGKPFLTAKFAMSLDGKIATRSGDSKWLTGEQSRGHVHQLRARSDAIMVGIKTVLADNPRLTARDDNGIPLGNQPLRIVVDSMARTPPAARIVSEPGNFLIAVSDADAVSETRLVEAGGEVQSLPNKDGSVDLENLLHFLGTRGITSVLVEGGGILLGSLFDQGLVDKIVAFVSPTILGGHNSPTPVSGVGVERMKDSLRLLKVEILQIGSEVAITGYC